MAKRENGYQAELIKRIEERFPGCFILKNDEWYLPGIPDLTILYGTRWAVLEVKRDAKGVLNPEPNQLYYVDLLNEMSFASFIYPAIEDEVLDALQHAFESRR